MKHNISNETFTGANGRHSLIDFTLPENFNGEVVLFIHGFMGFKDWGAWNLVQEYFVQKGFGFCKFNTSHNGGTTENGIDFPDPEAFGNNNYSKEIEDVGHVITWIKKYISSPKISIIGHSRGGAVALLSAMKYREIVSSVTWASISSIGDRFPINEELEEWKDSGVRFVKNGRTKQELPQYFQLYEDFKGHQEELNIERTCRELTKPVLIIHGEKDTSVPIENGQNLATWSGVSLHIIPDTDHVFGSRHPWSENALPSELRIVCEKSLTFLIK